MAQALRAFATQADISLGLSGVDLTGKLSTPVEGAATPEEALHRLLAGSDLAFEAIDASTFRIIKAPPTAAAIAPAPVEPPPPRIDVIIITASKRAQELRSAPFSITSIAKETLRYFGVRSATEVTSMVSGLGSTNQGPGRNKFFVRGLSDGAFAGNAQSPVGVYLDETRTSFNGPDPNLLLVDIDHVEVVRGPQGTLYGAGPISGLVKIVTRAPTFERVESSAQVDAAGAGAGSGPSGAVQGVYNVPIVADRFAVRAVVYGDHQGGYVDEASLGKKNVNQTNTAGFRLQSLLALGHDWSVRTTFTGQWVHAADTQYYNQSLAAYQRDDYLTEPYNNDFVGANFTVNGDLGWATLVSTTAWLRQAVTTRFDASLAIPTLIRAPVTAAPFDEDSRYYTVDHETRFISPGSGNFDWLGGVFLSRSTRGTQTRVRFLSAADDFYFKTRHDTAIEAALFGEATYTFAPKWSVTGGMRVFRGSLDVEANNSELIDDGPPQAVGQNSKTGVTPKATLAYRPDPDDLLYAQVSQGFRLGGVNIDNRISTTTPVRNARLTVTNFESDRLWNFELGAKSSFFDHTLSVNAAAYYAIWEHIQADLTRLNGMSFTANLGLVHNFGFDVDATYTPTPEWEFLANASLSDPTQNDAGSANRLPRVPKLSGLVAGKYERPVAPGVSAYATARVEFIGKTVLALGAGRDATLNPYGLVNARIGLKHGDWNLALYLDNALDSRANTFAYGNPFSLGHIPQTTPPRPRTVGISIGWSN